MLCTIHIPSRKRIERLKRTLQSIHDTAKPESFEIWLKFDDDDAESIAAIPELEQRWKVKVLVAPRLNGWASIEHYINLMAPQFEGTWLWVLNDDMTIEGSGWDDKLAQVPTDGVICHPEISKLGGSEHRHDSGGAFPAVPMRFWERLGQPRCERPYDTDCNQLARNNGWRTHFLPGLTTNHQRDDDRIIESHRTS